MFLCCCSVLSRIRLYATPWTAAHQASLSFIVTQLKFMSIESVMLSKHLILCRPLLLLPSVFPSIRFFSNESVLRSRWPKYWSFSFSISPTNEYSRLISFRIDWLDLFALQQIKSLLQHISQNTNSSPFSVLSVQRSYRTLLLGKPKLWLYEPLSAKWCLCSLICCIGLL